MNPETLTWTAGPLRLAVRRQLVRWSDHRAPGRCPVCMVDTPNRADHAADHLAEPDTYTHTRRPGE
jgi:hypothetical protein